MLCTCGLGFEAWSFGYCSGFWFAESEVWPTVFLLSFATKLQGQRLLNEIPLQALTRTCFTRIWESQDESAQCSTYREATDACG